MTDEPTHTVSEMAPRASIIVRKVKYLLRFVVSYVQPVTQNQELFEKRLCTPRRIPKEMVPRAPVISIIV